MKKLLFIILLVCVIIVLVVWLVVNSPKEYLGGSSLVPSDEIHGNKITNTIQSGYVCSNENNIFIGTSMGILKIDKESFETEIIIEDAGDSINAIGDILYYMLKGNIYEINLVNGQKRKILSNWYSIDEIDVIGDKIFSSKGLSGGYIAYVDNNKIYKLASASSNQNFIGYYKANYYYFDPSYKGKFYICKYDLETHEVQGIIHIKDYLSSYILDGNQIYYSYKKQGLNDKEKLNSIWTYNIDTGENAKIAGFDKSYTVKNVIGNKLILIDEWLSEYEAWYIYNLDNKEMTTIKDEYRCQSIFVVDNYIIAYYVGEEGNIFKFYNEEGEYLDFEIEY